MSKSNTGDANVDKLKDDPRRAPKVDGFRKVGNRFGKGRNTESFDPRSTFVRPSMRVIVGPKTKVYGKPLKHDDVVLVPEFFCDEDDWSIYYDLIKEMRQAQANRERQSEWLSWHEGCHLISKNPKGSKTYKKVLESCARYFGVKMTSVGTRFNWYRDSSDWKPFHHDSAAYNPHRAKNQNITVGLSFGSSRELAFLHAQCKERIYFPQTNGMMFAFGRDVNIKWKHAINALPVSEHTGKGRISIVLWGLCPNVIEEPNSPALLTNDTRRGYDNRAPAARRRDEQRKPARDEGRRRHDDRRRDDRRPNRRSDSRGDLRNEIRGGKGDSRGGRGDSRGGRGDIRIDRGGKSDIRIDRGGRSDSRSDRGGRSDSRGDSRGDRGGRGGGVRVERRRKERSRSRSRGRRPDNRNRGGGGGGGGGSSMNSALYPPR